MIGFLNVYKPEGLTSNAVVQKIKKKFHIKKIGHMGTLDPMATGILPIAIGKATRLFEYSLDKTKRYIATFNFGYTTDTLDITGQIISNDGYIPSSDDISKVLPKMIGKLSQIPPNFSAKNINGKRAYDLARSGIEFELTPKEVEIIDIRLIEQVSNNCYKFDIVCSSGTYIRSIARDMASYLKTYGCMSSLERIENGRFIKNNSIELDKLLEEDISKYLIKPEEVFNNFDIVEINDKMFKDLLNGIKFEFVKFYKPTFIKYNDKIVGVAKIDSNDLILDTFLYE